MGENTTLTTSHPVRDSAEAEAANETGFKVIPPDVYNSFFSEAAKARVPTPIRGLFPLERLPGVLSLLAGKPNPSTFPITSMSVKIKSPTGESEGLELDISGPDIAEGLQYGNTAGLPALLDWFTGLQEYCHKRKTGEGWRISMGAGSQDVIFKAIETLLNPGEPALVESPVYAGVIPLFNALHCDLIGVETDGDGIKPSNLRSILENWPDNKPRPKLLYTVPYGCNPTGVTATEPRRREVLALAKQYNFLILEDDPYYNLYFGTAPRPPSYFALEPEFGEVGRVLRFDSLSKILSSGLRIGFVSGPNAILDAMDLRTQSTNLQVSSLTQAITNQILRAWGYDGFIQHILTVSQFYKSKRDIFENAMKKHLSGLAEWNTPEAGMFFWFKPLISSDPNSVQDSGDLIRTRALANGVLALPGTVFLPEGGKCEYVRAAFSLLGKEDVEEAVIRLRKTILEARVELEQS